MKKYEAYLPIEKMPTSCSECIFSGVRETCPMKVCLPLTNTLHTTKLISLKGIRKDCPLQPIATNEEGEEALRSLEYIGDKDLYNGVHIQIKNTLKTKFQQMQQEIERLKVSVMPSNQNAIDDLYKKFSLYEKQNLQYTQLLDKIELKEIDNPKCTLINGVMGGENLVNILKELKSLGGK